MRLVLPEMIWRGPRIDRQHQLGCGAHARGRALPRAVKFVILTPDIKAITARATAAGQPLEPRDASAC